MRTELARHGGSSGRGVPADIRAAVLPDFAQRDVFLHFHGRGGPDREDADPDKRVAILTKTIWSAASQTLGIRDNEFEIKCVAMGRL